MKKPEIPAKAEVLKKEELQQLNGGIGGALLLMWCEYLLRHDDRLMDGMKDGFNEFKETLTS